MELNQKIVTKIPLNELWTDRNLIRASRLSNLNLEDVHNILKIQPITFVIANIGAPLIWIELNNSYSFWKDEVKKHIADDLKEIYLEVFPDNYAYLASKWIDQNQNIIILLEKLH